MYDITPLRTIKRFKAGSGVVLNILRRCARCFLKNLFSSFMKFEAEWLELGGASSLSGGREVVVIDPPVPDDLELLYEMDTRWTSYVCEGKPEL